MATYAATPSHERLNVFFSEFFREMRKADPSTYGAFLTRAEEEFKRMGYREKISAGVENILIVRLDVVGDQILTSGFIREVRANFPRAHITLIVSSLVYPIVELCPYVNEVLSFDIKPLDRTFPVMLENLAVFCRDNLWQKHYSIAFSPQCGGDNLPGLLMMWLSGARERIGYGFKTYKSLFNDEPKEVRSINNFLLNKLVKPHKAIPYQVEKCFYILTANGFKVNQKHLELFYSEADSLRAQELLQDIPPSCKKILIGIGSGEANRKYPVEKYLAALRELAKKNLVFVIVGGKSELADAEFLEKNLPAGKVLNFAGKTTLRETEAIISQSDFYIGNDSGVMHMAAAAKRPVLAIYREAADRQNISPVSLSEILNFPPWQTKAVILRPKHPLGECATLPPCYGHCHYLKPHCITQITPQQIVGAFEVLERL